MDELGEPELYTDEQWKLECKARAKELGVTQEQLAEHITGDPGKQSSISNLLSPQKHVMRSRFVLKISRALGVELPPIAQLELIHLENPADRKFLEALAQVAESRSK